MCYRHIDLFFGIDSMCYTRNVIFPAKEKTLSKFNAGIRQPQHKVKGGRHVNNKTDLSLTNNIV